VLHGVSEWGNCGNMPAALEIDWPSVRILAMAVGVREAARQLGISEGAVLQRSTREKWLADPQIRSVVARTVSERQSALSSAVITPAEAMQNELKKLNSESRMGFARGLHKAALSVQELSGDAVLEQAQNVKATIQSAATIHGWSASSPVVKVALNVTGEAHVQVSEEPHTMEAEWCDAGEAQSNVQAVDSWGVTMDDPAF